MDLQIPSMMLGLLVLASAGCGVSTDGTYPVEGSVTLTSGVPFMGGKVQFVSPDGDTFTTSTKSDGSFQLKKKSKAVGLEPGEYKVLVYEVNFDDIDSPPVKILDPKYRAVQTTDLTATVKEESNVFEFTLDPFEGR